MDLPTLFVLYNTNKLIFFQFMYILIEILLGKAKKSHINA